MHCIKRQWLAGVAACLVATTAAPLWAQVDINWNLVGGEGNWSNAANWTPANVPDAVDEWRHIPLTALATTVNLDMSPNVLGLWNESPLATLYLRGNSVTVGPGGGTNAGRQIAT